MISRRTNLIVLRIIVNNFVESVRKNKLYGNGSYYEKEIKRDELRNFLYLADVDAWSIEKIRNITFLSILENEILGLETGMFYSRKESFKYIKKWAKRFKTNYYWFF